MENLIMLAAKFKKTANAHMTDSERRIKKLTDEVLTITELSKRVYSMYMALNEDGMNDVTNDGKFQSQYTKLMVATKYLKEVLSDIPDSFDEEF